MVWPSQGASIKALQLMLWPDTQGHSRPSGHSPYGETSRWHRWKTL